MKASNEIHFQKAKETELNEIYQDIFLQSVEGHFTEIYSQDAQGKEYLRQLIIASHNEDEIPLYSEDKMEVVKWSPKLCSVVVQKQIVGYVLIFKRKNLVELLVAGIFPDFRGNGFGFLLAAHFKKLYKKHDLIVRCKENSKAMSHILLKLKFKINQVSPKGTTHFYL